MPRTFAQRIEKPLHTAGRHRHVQRQGLPRPQPRTRITAPMARYIGTAAILLGAAELLPLAVLLFYPQEQAYAPCFVFPALITMTAGYLLRSYEGRLAVFRQGCDTPELIFDVYTRLLPPADRDRLETGISAPDYETLTRLIEDYIS